MESLGIAAKCQRLEDELERKNKELECCRKRLREEEQKVKHCQRKALIYKAHILHLRKLYGITPKQEIEENWIDMPACQCISNIQITF